jgi:mRNA degradation ribonuclease J1/J2
MVVLEEIKHRGRQQLGDNAYVIAVVKIVEQVDTFTAKPETSAVGQRTSTKPR